MFLIWGEANLHRRKTRSLSAAVAIHFAACEEERADAKNLGMRRIKFLRVRSHRLDVFEFAVRCGALSQSLPAFEDHRLVLLAFEQTVIDAPGQAEGIKSRAAGFFQGIG